MPETLPLPFRCAEGPLTDAEVMALDYLGKAGCIGTVDAEEKLCAALVFIALQDRGLVQSVIGVDGPIFSLTDAGHRVLEERSSAA